MFFGGIGVNISPCNTENSVKRLFVTPYKSNLNQLVEEVVVTATL